MDPRYRARFNAAFTDSIYGAYEVDLSETINSGFPFRLAETPVFLPPDFRKRVERAAREVVDQLSDQQLICEMRRAIPERWDTPGMDHLPSFAQVDFAVTRGADGTLEPKLIELQGFPSLTAFQVVQRDAWVEQLAHMGLGEDWTCWFSGLTRSTFLDLARRTIVGDHDPAEVILLDIDPPLQKTWPDFAATKHLFDVDPESPTNLRKRGRSLWRPDPAQPTREIPVRRIHNRIVFDELEAKRVELPFCYQDELDVEWAPHPNWYWVWSKYSLPFLDHPSVPKATFVSELESIPADLGNSHVLKPLFSFAGGGVNVDPGPRDIESIPVDARNRWCIQEKIEYAPVLQSPDGGVKVEIRMMFLRPDDEPRMILAQNLCRLSRGKMLGVDFNKDMSWVGSSVGLFQGSEK